MCSHALRRAHQSEEVQAFGRGELCEATGENGSLDDATGGAIVHDDIPAGIEHHRGIRLMMRQHPSEYHAWKAQLGAG